MRRKQFTATMALIWAPPAFASPVTTPMLATPQQSSQINGSIPTGVVQQEHPTLSARQRKQVYMSSAIFEAGGAPPQSMYNKSRQNDVYGDVKRKLPTPHTQQIIVFPSPADLKATANSGHGVLHGTCTLANESTQGNDQKNATFFQYGNSKEQIRIVHANRSYDSIPREFKSTNTNLHWTDSRNERVCARGQEFFRARQSMDANSLKRQELSSEVFGSIRNLEKSAASPSQELRSVGMNNVHCTDSRLDRAVSREPESRPMSARERLTKNLFVSSNSQFSDDKDSKRQNHASASPLRSWRNGLANHEDASTKQRRRTERNYSDLFGEPPPLEKVKSQASQKLAKDEAFVYRPAPRVKDSAGQRIQSEERACWDARHSMDSNLEIARRRRERSLQPNRTIQTPREQSATERKQLEQKSGQLRKGTGAAPEPRDDVIYKPSKSTAALKKTCDSPSTTFDNVQPDTARGRKAMSLRSSCIW